MCGISAIYRYTKVSDDDLKKLDHMNSQMKYRGPDDEGVWHDEKCVLAQVRLGIIGLEKGKQPLMNEDGSVVMVCNGEIYNYLELKQMLLRKGHVFNSDSDSETIIHLYEEYGKKCVDYLRGMFAFCLYDTKQEKLLAVRDRIGEKTLYYSQIPCGVVFSTELKAILKEYVPEPQINIEHLLEPIRYTGSIDRKYTFVEQICRVLPGQIIEVDASGAHSEMYWERKHNDDFGGTSEEAKRETLRLMQESVDICLRSDVPVAVMLSGGVDSSSVAALAKRSGRTVHTITAGYMGDFECDERNSARRFAKEFGLDYNEVVLDKKDYLDCFDELTQYIDEPITDAAAIAQWALYKKVKSLGFKVLLGGMGGDELFFGYPAWNALGESLELRREHESIFPWNTVEKKKHFVRFILKNLKKVLCAMYPNKLEDASYSWWNYCDFVKAVDGSRIKIAGQETVLNKYMVEQTFPICPLGQELDAVYDHAFDNVMVGAYLYLSDRLGMGNSIEIRSPLLDYKLVEHAMSLPHSIRYKSGHPKQYMKDVLKGIVPDYILYAPKKGFAPPTQYVMDVVGNYKYRYFNLSNGFYNTALADKLLHELKIPID